MFRLDNLLERWTEIYAPMQHNPSATAKPEEKAFFLIDRWADQNEFQRTFNLLHKPSLCYCTTIEAQLAQNNPKQVMYQYNWYLACKQRSTGNPLADDEGAALAKFDLNDMMLDLLAFLFTMRGYVRGRTLPKDCPDAVRDIGNAVSDALKDISGTLARIFDNFPCSVRDSLGGRLCVRSECHQ